MSECFNPSFCGFGIGGVNVNPFIINQSIVSILVSVDSVLEVQGKQHPIFW